MGAPFLLIKALAGGHGIKERLGHIPKRKSNRRLFWFHAASVGELKILSSVIPKIRKKYRDIDFAVSTTTITGKAKAIGILGDYATVFLHPIELKSAIQRTISRIKPEKLIVVETELWPLVLRVALDRGIKPFLINGRMSAKSFRWYKTFRPLFSPIISRFEKIIVQTEGDAERYERLGAKRISIVGNIKYDQVLNECELRSPEINFGNIENLKFVAGSLRKGEDDILIELADKSFDSDLPCQFIFVPRHMKDLEGLCNKLKEKSINYILWSEYRGEVINDKTVLIVNTMGELPAFYSIADIAFVGGSLVTIGGHDPVEPAAMGKTVIFGPYMDNAAEAASALLESGGAMQVKNSDQILDFLRKACDNSGILIDKGERCKNAVKSLSGASEKTVRLLMKEDS
jgi:3-deoxy-D-manno-octulosonic-acid transferase